MATRDERAAIVAATASKRKSIFRRLVAAEDAGGPVDEARIYIANLFRISLEQLEQIIEEGLAKDWTLPPISAAA